MKFKKAKFAMLVSALISGSVLATEATDILQWTGSVPELTTTSSSFKIINTGIKEFTAGSVVFSNDATNGIAITGSSQLKFNVVDNADNPVSAFNYQLSEVKFSKSGGFMQPTDKIGFVSGGQDVLLATDSAGNSAEGVSVQLKTGGVDTSLGLQGGDDVIIQATLLVGSVTP